MNSESTLLISKDDSLPDLDEPYHQCFIHSVLSCLNEDNAHLSVSFIQDDEMLALNAMYRGVRKTTDVLSFALRDGGIAGDQSALGDIVISYQQAAVQAHDFQHAVADEINELIFHGLLHLMGYDHEHNLEEWRQAELGLIQLLENTNAPYIPKGMCGVTLIDSD